MDQLALENKQLVIYDIIFNILQAYYINCLVIEDRIKNLIRKLFFLVNVDINFMICFLKIIIFMQLYIQKFYGDGDFIM